MADPDPDDLLGASGRLLIACGAAMSLALLVAAVAGLAELLFVIFGD